jgi:hypothetical protein
MCAMHVLHIVQSSTALQRRPAVRARSSARACSNRAGGEHVRQPLPAVSLGPRTKGGDTQAHHGSASSGFGGIDGDRGSTPLSKSRLLLLQGTTTAGKTPLARTNSTQLLHGRHMPPSAMELHRPAAPPSLPAQQPGGCHIVPAARSSGGGALQRRTTSADSLQPALAVPGGGQLLRVALALRGMLAHRTPPAAGTLQPVVAAAPPAPAPLMLRHASWPTPAAQLAAPRHESSAWGMHGTAAAAATALLDGASGGGTARLVGGCPAGGAGGTSRGGGGGGGGGVYYSSGSSSPFAWGASSSSTSTQGGVPSVGAAALPSGALRLARLGIALMGLTAAAALVAIWREEHSRPPASTRGITSAPAAPPGTTGISERRAAAAALQLHARAARAGGGGGDRLSSGAAAAAAAAPLDAASEQPGFHEWMVARLQSTLRQFEDEEAMLRAELAALTALHGSGGGGADARAAVPGWLRGAWFGRRSGQESRVDRPAAMAAGVAASAGTAAPPAAAAAAATVATATAQQPSSVDMSPAAVRVRVGELREQLDSLAVLRAALTGELEEQRGAATRAQVTRLGVTATMLAEGH